MAVDHIQSGLITSLAQGSLDPNPTFRKMLSRLSLADQIAALPTLSDDTTFALLLSTKPMSKAVAPSASTNTGTYTLSR